MPSSSIAISPKSASPSTAASGARRRPRPSRHQTRRRLMRTLGLAATRMASTGLFGFGCRGSQPRVRPERGALSTLSANLGRSRCPQPGGPRRMKPVCAVRRAPQNGQNPRRSHQKAIVGASLQNNHRPNSLAWWQPSAGSHRPGVRAPAGRPVADATAPQGRVDRGHTFLLRCAPQSAKLGGGIAPIDHCPTPPPN